MSTGSELAERTDQVPAARGLARAVKPACRGRAATEIHAIGLLYAALLAILFVPLLPFAVVIWAVWRVGKGPGVHRGRREHGTGCAGSPTPLAGDLIGIPGATAAPDTRPI